MELGKVLFFMNTHLKVPDFTAQESIPGGRDWTEIRCVWVKIDTIIPNILILLSHGSFVYPIDLFQFLGTGQDRPLLSVIFLILMSHAERRFTLRLPKEDMDLVDLYLKDHPFRFQTVTELIRHSIREFLAPRVLDPKTATLKVELTGQAFTRLTETMDRFRNYDRPDNLISEAILEFAKQKLDEEQEYQKKVKVFESSQATFATILSGMVEE